jgi:[protein-PII] uridylyltransferase
MKPRLASSSGQDSTLSMDLSTRITQHLATWPDALQAADGAQVFLETHTRLIDELLKSYWPQELAAGAATLVAVGGYGRGEQFPHSDIDLLILLETHQFDAVIQDFLCRLWDAGLVIGHAVRTVEECLIAGRDDVTVYTNLLDARLITGNADLFTQLDRLVRSDQVFQDWSFFQAKTAEQAMRYRAFDEMGAKIEPNVKESPGGLRDLHTLRWIGNRVAGARTLNAMHAHGLLGDREWQTLTEAEAFISQVRIGLHALAGRAEERLLLLHQKTLAAQFGYEGEQDGNLAVERFMQRYFRTTIEIERLNQLILQNFRETLDPHPDNHIIPINARFRIRGHLLETTDAQVFMRSPTAILELFLLLAQHTELLGQSAATARQLRANLSVIDDGFRKNPQAQQLFMAIWQNKTGIYRALKAMNLSGVLAAYIPAFSEIVGLMQFDLFHAYTVDAHTLLVIRNLRRFSQPEFADEHPMASQIIDRVHHREVLYLAGLFHDIAKGRGGDHAELGAIDARQFAEVHGLPTIEVERLVWLVEQHLLMSFTAQRRDIEDPTVVEEFARSVGSIARLDDLYLLTVADICATNLNLWNSWRDALLKRLHQLTVNWFNQGEQSAREIVDATRAAAMREGIEARIPAKDLGDWFNSLPDDYFLRTDIAPVLQHARLVLGEKSLPILWISNTPDQDAIQILALTSNCHGQFARIVTELDRSGLNVQSANMTVISPTAAHPENRALFEFFILDQHNGARLDHWSLEALHQRLLARLQSPDVIRTRIHRRMPPQLASIDVETQIQFLSDHRRQRTEIQICTKDRPGLLADITSAFADLDISLNHARVSTLGERVEDAFYVVDRQGRAVDSPKRCTDIETALRAAIHSRP